MSISIEKRIVSRIYGRGRGWVFSQKDFLQIATRDAVDKAFERLLEKGIIRKVIRGIYDYPKFSKILDQAISPDLDQVAAALARKFGWNVEITGPSALNLMGISTQVPGRIVYASNGPDKVYKIGKQTLEFRNQSLKETSLKYRESFVIVQGLKSLGQERIDQAVIEKIAIWVPNQMRRKILKDTSTSSEWIYKNIKQICHERNGQWKNLSN